MCVQNSLGLTLPFLYFASPHPLVPRTTLTPSGFHPSPSPSRSAPTPTPTPPQAHALRTDPPLASASRHFPSRSPCPPLPYLSPLLRRHTPTVVPALKTRGDKVVTLACGSSHTLVVGDAGQVFTPLCTPFHSSPQPGSACMWARSSRGDQAPLASSATAPTPTCVFQRK